MWMFLVEGLYVAGVIKAHSAISSKVLVFPAFNS